MTCVLLPLFGSMKCEAHDGNNSLGGSAIGTTGVSTAAAALVSSPGSRRHAAGQNGQSPSRLFRQVASRLPSPPWRKEHATMPTINYQRRRVATWCLRPKGGLMPRGSSKTIRCFCRPHLQSPGSHGTQKHQHSTSHPPPSMQADVRASAPACR